MDLGISGKTAIVCASSRGLGRGCAEALAAAGCHVVINGRDADILAKTAKEITESSAAKITPVAADVATPDGQQALLDAADQLKWAIRAREVTLEQRRDDEAHAIRERAPSLGQQVELLQFAAGLWDEFGHEEKARVIRETAERLWAHRPREGRPERPADPIERRISSTITSCDPYS